MSKCEQLNWHLHKAVLAVHTQSRGGSVLSLPEQEHQGLEEGAEVVVPINGGFII